ncbi:MAG: AraC family transcriptional regulator [Chloroherpetonaceae bacterium]|nr:AraC family transcriptional regulator [Chloroherpetonaceae bacterium]
MPLNSLRQRLEKRLQTLIENRSVYTLENSELNLFETYQRCYAVELQFRDPIAVMMIQGKKMMHLREKHHFDFLPNQSLILPANETMRIDFPEATLTNPTRCLALAISPDLIRAVASDLNERFPKLDREPWNVDCEKFYLGDDPRVAQTIHQLVQIFTDDEPAKELLASLKLRELLVRVMQTQARTLLLEQCKRFLNHNRIAAAIDYIRTHLCERIRIDDLCKKSCMSKAQFFRAFKQELGITPVEFINQERVKRAKELLAYSRLSVSEVCFQVGFGSLAYFDRVFKHYVGMSPRRYQQESLAKLNGQC